MIERTATDRQVVDAVLAGDREAFRVLVDRESGNVIGVCRRVLGDPLEAEDAAQDALTKAYQALATYRGDGPFGAWLRRIAVRVAIARLAARQYTSPPPGADRVTTRRRSSSDWSTGQMSSPRSRLCRPRSARS